MIAKDHAHWDFGVQHQEILGIQVLLMLLEMWFNA